LRLRRVKIFAETLTKILAESVREKQRKREQKDTDIRGYFMERENGSARETEAGETM
jgi:hypothetical protein